MINGRVWVFAGLGLLLWAGQASHASLAGGSSDTAVVRAIVEQIDRQPESARLHFAVPVDVLREISRETQAQALPALSDAPVAGLLDSWAAVITPKENRVEVTLCMTATVFTATSASPFVLPLFPVNEVFADVRLNDIAVDPIEQDGWWVLVIDAVGPVRIRATLTRRMKRSDGTIALRLDKQPFSIATVAVRSDALVDLAAESAGRLATATMGPDAIRPLPVGMGERVNLTIRPHRERPIQLGTPSIESAFVWTVGDRGLTANGRVDISILGGRRDRVTLKLPSGADNLNVSGPEVRETRRTGATLEIFFNRAISSRTPVQLSFQVPRAKSQDFICPELGVEGGRIDSAGWLLIVNDAGGEILEAEVKGLVPASSLELPQHVAGLSTGKPAFLYRRTAPRVTARFETVGTLPFPMRDTIADRADIVATVRPAGDEIVRIRYSIRNNRRQFLRLRPPSGARLLSASVEQKHCRVSRDGEDWLIPLAKSIQTLGGLISFPVELVYARQGEPFTDRAERTCRLPRLEDVPVAVVNVTWSCPNGLRLRRYDSALQMAKTFTQAGPNAMTYGYGYAQPTDDAPAPVTEIDLANNYYRVGYAAYQDGRLEEAERLLGNVNSLAGEGEITRNAADLLSNIKLGRGEFDSRLDSAGRAKVAAIQRGLEGKNVELASEQQEMIASGLEMIQRGDAELGAELLAEADKKGGQLRQRSASSTEQQAVTAQYETQFSQVRLQQKENKKLLKQLGELQSTTRAWSTEAQSGNQQPTVHFSQALATVAEEENLDIETLQEAAFGLNVKALGKGEKQNLGRRFQAKRATQTDSRLTSQPSLSTRNLRLKRQVDALERVVEVSKQKPSTSQSGPARITLSPTQYANVRGQVAVVRRKAQIVAGQIAKPTAGNASGVAELMDEKAALKELGELKAWWGANSMAFANADETLKMDFQNLQADIQKSEKDVMQKHKEQQMVQTVTVDLSKVLGDRGRSDQDAFGLFLGANYVGALSNTVGTVAVANGKISVDNTYSNSDVLNDAVSNFWKNDGMVAHVKGSNVKVPLLGDIPLLGKLFHERLQEGQRYAILDEAEYRTLLDAGNRISAGQQDSVVDATDRDVIVGSWNTAAGQDFRLATGGETYNGLMVNGSTIDLPHDRYLAIDNGGVVTVIHGGQVRDWQDAAPAPTPLIPDVSQTFDIPHVGTPLYFEKTYLEAGESPDVVLRYTYKGEPT